MICYSNPLSKLFDISLQIWKIWDNAENCHFSLRTWFDIVRNEQKLMMYFIYFTIYWILNIQLSGGENAPLLSISYY